MASKHFHLFSSCSRNSRNRLWFTARLDVVSARKPVVTQ